MDVVGFLITRDVVRGGYPFLEAIHAALGLCQRIHVLDGESTDETWSALNQLREIVGFERLVLLREAWRERPGQHLLRAATNQLREQLPKRRDDWLFNFQANEIVPPESAREIATVFGRFPKRMLFRLPFTAVMGLRYAVRTRHRGRLFVNDPRFESLGDAFDCGLDRSRLLRAPWVTPGFVQLRRRSAIVHLEHPILRFRAPLPGDYPTKLANRVRFEARAARMQAELDVAGKVLARARAGHWSIEEFWAQIPYLRGDAIDAGGPVSPANRFVAVPSVLEHFEGEWAYDVERSLAALAERDVPSPSTGFGVDA